MKKNIYKALIFNVVMSPMAIGLTWYDIHLAYEALINPRISIEAVGTLACVCGFIIAFWLYFTARILAGWSWESYFKG